MHLLSVSEFKEEVTDPFTILGQKFMLSLKGEVKWMFLGQYPLHTCGWGPIEPKKVIFYPHLASLISEIEFSAICILIVSTKSQNGYS